MEVFGLADSVSARKPDSGNISLQRPTTVSLKVSHNAYYSMKLNGLTFLVFGSAAPLVFAISIKALPDIELAALSACPFLP